MAISVPRVLFDLKTELKRDRELRNQKEQERIREVRNKEYKKDKKIINADIDAAIRAMEDNSKVDDDESDDERVLEREDERVLERVVLDPETNQYKRVIVADDGREYDIIIFYDGESEYEIVVVNDDSEDESEDESKNKNGSKKPRGLLSRLLLILERICKLCHNKLTKLFKNL